MSKISDLKGVSPESSGDSHKNNNSPIATLERRVATLETVVGNLTKTVSQLVKSMHQSGELANEGHQPKHSAAVPTANSILESEGIAAAIAALASGRVADRTSAPRHHQNLHSTAYNDAAPPYWGDLDNESSRAKAAGDTLIVDQWECISCGTCVENAPDNFLLPSNGKAVAMAQEGDMDRIQYAIEACPVTCIVWTPEPDSVDQENDVNGMPLD